MNRDDIIRMAREVGYSEYTANLYAPDLERFAALVATEVDKNWVQGKAKISIPTETMEQEFSNYHRLGYKAGAAAEREACALVLDKVIEHLYIYNYDGDASTELRKCAKAIRARGEK